MEKKGKLELTWVGKYEEEKLEPRILIEDKSKSYGDPNTENMLIHGDNLLALKALERDYAGKIKCVYIDPPYNTGNAFEHYDDNLEHSIWLGMMRERLVLLHKLLCDEGFLCCHIDDSEGAYLKVLLDEIFGRQNYLTTIYVRVRYPEKTLKQDMAFHKEIEHIHVYRKSSSAQPILEKVSSGFEKFIYKIETEDTPSKILELGGKKVEIFKRGQYKILEEEGSEYGLKEIWASGTILDGNSSGRFFRDYLTGRYEEDGLGVLYKVYPVRYIQEEMVVEKTSDIQIFIFNISKIFTRGDLEFKFHKFNENLGGSFADVLRSFDDLVICMDEAHRYYAPASKKAINYLNPVLGLEYTATPKSTNKNIIYHYGLEDGAGKFLKIPVVMGRTNTAGYSDDDIEEMKLKDGIKLHERRKSIVYKYCIDNQLEQVKPIVLIACKDTTHARKIKEKIDSDAFFGGRYVGKVIEIDSRGLKKTDICVKGRKH